MLPKRRLGSSRVPRPRALSPHCPLKPRLNMTSPTSICTPAQPTMRRQQSQWLCLLEKAPRQYPSLSTKSPSVQSKAFLRRTCSTSAPTPALDPVTDSLPGRWLSDLKQRLGKCIIFGLKPAQLDEAGGILRVLASDWRALVAGSEGFLTGNGRAGLEGQNVAWGEMVSPRPPEEAICSTTGGEPQADVSGHRT